MKKIFGILRSIYDFTLECSTKAYAYWVLLFVAFTESIFNPIPPETLLIPMSLAKRSRSFFYAFSTGNASTIGAIGGYYIGMHIWPIIQPIFFQYIFSAEEFNKVVSIFNDNTFWTMFVTGFTPIPFKIFTIAAGAAKANLVTFILACFVSRNLRYLLIALIMFIFGEKAKKFIEKRFELVTILFTVLILAILFLIKH